MKYTEEIMTQMCNDRNLTFVGFSYHIFDKKRRCVDFICNIHKNKGMQFRPVEKMKYNKPCQYCNHSLLKQTFAEEMGTINPNIEILGNYIDIDTPIECYCKIHNHIWMGIPKCLLTGTGCPICSRIKAWDTRGRINTEIFKERMAYINPNIEIVSEYMGSHELIECRCKIHGIFWKSYACNIQNQSAGCPECAMYNQIHSQQLSNEDFVERIKSSTPHMIPISEYNGYDNKVTMHCTIHNVDFNIIPRSYFKHGGLRGCYMCTQSVGEIKLINSLLDKGYRISTQHSFDGCIHKYPLRFDAYDVDNNIAYEYQGQQHYYPIPFNGDIDKAKKEFQEGQIRDAIKEEYCKTHNIPLVRIPYWDIDNMANYIK